MTYKLYDREKTRIDPRELSKFATEVDALAKRRFGVDYEGSCPVRAYITDRSRFGPNHYEAMERNDWDGPREKEIKLRNLRFAAMNVAIAGEDIRLAVAHILDDASKEAREKAKAT